MITIRNDQDVEEDPLLPDPDPPPDEQIERGTSLIQAMMLAIKLLLLLQTQTSTKKYNTTYMMMTRKTRGPIKINVQ